MARLTETQLEFIRAASRAGRTGQSVADELDVRLNTVLAAARRICFPFKNTGRPPKVTKGPDSPERIERMKAGVLAAKARREGMGDGL